LLLRQTDKLLEYLYYQVWLYEYQQMAKSQLLSQYLTHREKHQRQN
jgi:hypothetical protein